MRGTRYGDFSRSSFDPRDYAGLMAQQGRVQLDSDWNEQMTLTDRSLRTALRDLVGPDGAVGDGFAIRPTIALELRPHGAAVLDRPGTLADASVSFEARALGAGRLLSWEHRGAEYKVEVTVDGALVLSARPEERAGWSMARSSETPSPLPWTESIVIEVRNSEGGLRLLAGGHAVASVPFRSGGDATPARLWLGGKERDGAHAVFRELRVWSGPGRDELVGHWSLASGRGTEEPDSVLGPSLRLRSSDDSSHPAFSWVLLDLEAASGRYYVDGVKASLDAPLRYRSRSNGLGLPEPGQRHVVFVEVSERSVSADEDNSLREVALHGLDTAVRREVVSTLGAAPFPPETDDVGAALEDHAATTGRMRASHDGGTAPANALYRVEVHRGGSTSATPPPSVKWSRTNGSVTVPVETGEDEHTLRLLPWGPGDLPLAAGDVVELVGPPPAGALGVVRSVSAEERRVTLDPAPTPLGSLNAVLRRWDHDASAATEEGALAIAAGRWIELEDGIRVAFDDGTYRAGDYWWVVARRDTGTIEWPQTHGRPRPVAPDGVERLRAPLAVVDLRDGEVEVSDVRRILEPLAAAPVPRAAPPAPPPPEEPVRTPPPPPPPAAPASSPEHAVVAPAGLLPEGYRRTGLRLHPRSTWTRPLQLPLSSGAVVVGAAVFEGRVLVVTEREVWSLGRGAPARVARLPQPRTGFGCCSVGGKLYLVGGRRIGARRDDGELLSLDPATGKWAVGPRLPERVSEATVVAARGHVHVLGGLRRGSVFTRTSRSHQVFDPRARAWGQAPPLPSRCCDAMGAAAPDGRVHLAGGRSAWLFGRDSLVEHHSLAPATSVWAREDELPRPRWGAATACTTSEIVIAGGSDPGGKTASAMAFDLVTRVWTSIAPAPHSFGGGAAFAVGSTVGMVGTAADRTTGVETMTSPSQWEIFVPDR